MSQSPILSVILPVYNCEKFVSEAVQSVLNQTFSDFELLIIDDCSTDATVSIIQSFSDDRINLICKKKNSGYTDSLNYAISIAKGNYIARMDGDDVCLPSRFQKQIKIMNADEEVILCGTAVQIIDSDTILKHPINHDYIKLKLCFSNAFFHPTVMFRKEVFNTFQYNKNFEPAEDYDLWTQLVFKGKVINIDEVLLKYRVHANQISNYKNEIQVNSAKIAQTRMFQVLDKNNNIETKIINKAFTKQKDYSINDFKEVLRFFNDMILHNDKFNFYLKNEFKVNMNYFKILFLKNYFILNGVNLKHILIYFKNIKFIEMLKISGFLKSKKAIYK